MKIETRPWGKMWKLLWGHTWWLKVILVRGRTSLQWHFNRNEIHLRILPFPKIKYVRKFRRHRMEKGLYIEIAFGGYCSEGDIIRVEDDYGRK